MYTCLFGSHGSRQGQAGLAVLDLCPLDYFFGLEQFQNQLIKLTPESNQKSQVRRDLYLRSLVSAGASIPRSGARYPVRLASVTDNNVRLV